jgi:D-xylulose reductase
MPKLELAAKYPGVTPVNVREQDLAEVVRKATEGWGADIVFEASANERAMQGLFEPLCPGGCVVFIGIPLSAVPLDIVAAQQRKCESKTSSAMRMFSRALLP